jgi:hypothetical protein
MARKLATVRRISEIIPIEGADVIELAKIDGWQCVVKKGEFKVGDLGMYFEIDSFVDTSQAPFAFLEKNAKEWNGKRGAIIRTMKLKGQISQGLLLPISWFEKHLYFRFGGFSLLRMSDETLLDKDFTDAIGVLKYEKIVEDVEERKGSGWFHRFLLEHVSRENRVRIFAVLNVFLPQKKRFRNQRISTFPSFIPKTDEERIQNIFSKVKSVHAGWYIPTLKLDGSSATYYVKNKEFGHCSRNLKLGLDDGSNFSKMAKKYNFPELFAEMPLNIALQFELMGPGIQGNKEKFEDHDLYLFKVWEIDERRYYNPTERAILVNKLRDLGCDLKQVPHYDKVHTDDFPTVESFLEFAEGPSLVNPVREGIVFVKEDGSFSFKAISNKFLLKNGE